MAESYEPLNPRNPFETPASARTDVLPVGSGDPMLGNVDENDQDSRIIRDVLGVGPSLLQNVGATTFLGVAQDVGQNPGLKKDALELKGVNWETPRDASVPKTFQNDPGFWNVDYDPEGKQGDEVTAANVFGRQFSRAELEKDDEGRRLLTLMEAQRKGEYRNEGFLSGLTSISDVSGSSKKLLSYIPFVGWMMETGSTIGETVSMSKTMKKMQAGEKVTDHEALAVRRFMLQQEMEGERGIGYNAGSLIQSSVPLMVEMAASGALVAASAKAGMAIGGAIGSVLPVGGTVVGGVVGGAIGALGALVFGGFGRLGSFLTRKGAAKAASKIGTKVLKDAAETTFEQGFDKAMRNEVFSKAVEVSGLSSRQLAKAAGVAGEERALEAIGRDLAKDLPASRLASMSKADFVQLARSKYDFKAGRAAFLERRKFEATKYLGEQFQNAYAGTLDKSLARYMLVNGDVDGTIRGGLRHIVEVAAISKSGAAKPLEEMSRAEFNAAMRKGYKALVDSGDLDKIVSEAMNGTLEGVAGQFEPGVMTALKAVRDRLGKKNFSEAVYQSISESLGKAATGNFGYSKGVASRIVDIAKEDLALRYGGTGTLKDTLARNGERMFRWLGEGIADGALRLDASAFGGMGTAARAASTFGGKVGALKTALRVGLVEAPVRQSLMYAGQAPAWLAATAAFSDDHNPLDMTFRGQLRIQAKALETGDVDLMRHAQAIAFGQGLVEYVSEGVGRGFNVVGTGIVGPALKDILPKGTRELGSRMARKVEALFGTTEMLKASNQDKLVDAVRTKLVGEAARLGKSAASISENDVRKFVAARSSAGLSSLNSFIREAGLSDRGLLYGAIRDKITSSKLQAATYYVVSCELLRRGITPQAFAKTLERVGYDGVVSEMLEERYGGVVQGILGLDSTPSDSGFRERIKAALDGLFPSPSQLVTEAIGFAFPGVAQMGFNQLYSRIGAGGAMGELRNAVEAVNVTRNSRMETAIDGVTPEYAAKVQEHLMKIRDIHDRKFGTKAANEAAIVSNSAALTADIAAEASKGDAGKYASHERMRRFSELKSEDEVKRMMNETAAQIINRSGTKDELEKNLKDYGADVIFGAAGVEAIRNTVRQKDGYEDEVTAEFYGEDGEYQKALDEIPLPGTVSSSADSIVNQVTMSVPVVADDAVMVDALRRRADAKASDTEVRLNQYGTEIVGSLRDNFIKIADAGFRMKVNASAADSLSWWRKGLMRAVGVLDAITTGDLSLAARDPAKWVMADAGLPVGLMHELVSLKEASVRRGMADALLEAENDREGLLATLGGAQAAALEPMLAEYDELRERVNAARGGDRQDLVKQAEDKRAEIQKALDVASGEALEYAVKGGPFSSPELMERFEKAGEPYFRASVEAFAAQYLTAKNVLAVSNGDIEKAAWSVVAHNNRNEDGPVERYYLGKNRTGKLIDSFDTDDFRRAHADELEDAKQRIVQAVVKVAVNRSIAVNSDGATPGMAFNYERALRHGSGTDGMHEVVAALQEMPAFASMRTVHDLSYGNFLTDESLAAFSRTADVGTIVRLPEDDDLTPEQLSLMSRVLGVADPARTDYGDLQAKAHQFIRRLRVAIEDMIPARHEDANGNAVGVSYSFGFDRDGNRVVTATVARSATGTVETYTAPTVLECTRILESLPDEARVIADYGSIVLTKGFTIASRDATSAAVFQMGDRNAARAYFIREAKMAPGNVDEMRLPPWLRKTPDKSDWLYSDSEEAADVLYDEMSRARGSSSAAAAKVLDGSPESPGYEVVAARYLEALGIHPTALDPAAHSVLGGASYVLAPSFLRTSSGKMMVVSDYQSSGDVEAFARMTVDRTIDQARRNPGMLGDGITRDDVSATLVGVEMEFRRKAEELAASLRADHPEFADRVKAAVDYFGQPSLGSVNTDLMAAIVTSTFGFTCERGLRQDGNGFLFAPELALVADEFRETKWAGLLLDLVDRAFGGDGLFREDTSDLRGIEKFVTAFAPPTSAIVESRAAALFSRAGEGGKKPPIRLPGFTVATGSTEVDFSPTAFTEEDRPSGYTTMEILRSVAVDAQKAVAELKKRGITADTHFMVQSIMKGGTARPSLTVRNVNPETVKVGGVTVSSAARADEARQGTSELITEARALDVARGFDFMSDSLLRGDRLGENQAQAIVPLIRDEVKAYLCARNVPYEARELILGQLENAYQTRGEPDMPETAEPEAEETEDEVDERDDEKAAGNGDIFDDFKKAREAVDNADLVAVGSILQNLFPSEQRNHTAILFRLSAEVPQLVEELAGLDEKARAELGVDATDLEQLQLLSSQLNPLRGPHEKATAETVQEMGGLWTDNEATDALLRNAVRCFRDAGATTVAYALNALRKISTRGGRRAKALNALSFMSRSDANQVNVTVEDGVVSFDSDEAGVGDLAPHTAVQSVVTHVLSSGRMFDVGMSPDRFGVALARLDRLFRGNLNVAYVVDESRGYYSTASSRNEDPDERRRETVELAGRGEKDAENYPGYLPAGTSRREIRGMLTADGGETSSVSALDDLLKSMFKWHIGKNGEVEFDRTEDGKPVWQPGETGEMSVARYEILLKFAEALRSRFAKVASVVDYAFGYDNELAFVLRNPDLVQRIVHDLSRSLRSEDGFGTAMSLLAMYRSTLPQDYSLCPLVSEAVVNPLVNAAYDTPYYMADLARAEGRTPSPVNADRAWSVEWFCSANDVVPEAVLETWQRSSRSVIATRMTQHRQSVDPADRSMNEPDAARAYSRVTSVFGYYQAAMPRAVAKVDAKATDGTGFHENGQAVQVGASAIAAEYRLVDTLLPVLGLRDEYLGNLSRFRDGSRLNIVTAGAKFGDTLADGDLLSTLVYRSNLADFTEGKNLRSVKFQLFHGEKPTVNSIQLPWYAAQKLWNLVRSGDEDVMNPYLRRNGVMERVKALPEDVFADGVSGEQRAEAYQAMFSVVSTFAKCDQLDTKRVQALLAQGVPFTGYRDVAPAVEAVGAKDEYRRGKKVVRMKTAAEAGLTDAKGEPVEPGVYSVLVLSGHRLAEANMGAYFSSGYQSDQQAARAKDGRAISHKVHENDMLGAALLKGQSHDFGLGVDENELVPVSGVDREAQRLGRREVERVLGLTEGILDIPDARQKEDKDWMQEREKAVAKYRVFRRYCSYRYMDREIWKAGPLSARCGFSAPSSDSVVSLKVAGHECTFRVAKEKGVERAYVTIDGKARDASSALVPEHKNGCYTVDMVVQAVMSAATDEDKIHDELSEADVASIESVFRMPDGTVTESAMRLAEVPNMFLNMGKKGGERLSFFRNENGGYGVRYFSRRFVAQQMANSHDKSSVHTTNMASNAKRDLESNFARLAKAWDGAIDPAVVNTVASGIGQICLRAYPEPVERAKYSDPQFKAKADRHPNSDYVKESATRKAGSAYAKRMKVHVNANHSVYMTSGAKAYIDQDRRTVDLDWTVGADQYDKDTFTPERNFDPDVAREYGVVMSYATGRVNFRQKDDTFRYGYHVDDDRFDETLAELHKMRDEIPEFRNILHPTWARLERAYFPESRREELNQDPEVDKTELARVAYVAALIQYANRFPVGSEMANRYRKMLGHMFTDYTGRHLDDYDSTVSRVTFDDLFLPDGRFDLAAMEFGAFRRTSRNVGEDGNPKREIFIGGSFFVGDRRPSGNFESAQGLCRAQAPVLYDRATGEPGPTALYVLDPTVGVVQGADTDGDSTTCCRMVGPVDADIREMITFVWDRIRAAYAPSEETGGNRIGLISEQWCKDLMNELWNVAKFRKFLRMQVGIANKQAKEITLSAEFDRQVGNLLVETQVNNHRMLESIDENGGVGTSRAETGADRAARIRHQAPETGRYDPNLGYAGRSPVGPDAVFDQAVPEGDAETRAIYREETGKDLGEASYKDAFKTVVKRISDGVVPEIDMLVAKNAAALNAYAANASGARGIGVSLQAALQHMQAYASDDAVANLYPALFRHYRNDAGEVVYCPHEAFNGHTDGIDNSLFDVVKDLFAPRAGWQKDMLQYLWARLLGRMDREAVTRDEYGDVTDVDIAKRFGNAWFFRELVSYAKDLHRDEFSIAGLLAKAAAGNNYMNYEDVMYANRQKTFRGLVSDAVGDETSVLSAFAGLVSSMRFGKPEKDENGRVMTMLDVARRDVLDRDGFAFADDFATWVRSLSYRLIGTKKTKYREREETIDALARGYADGSLGGTLRGIVESYMTSDGSARDAAYAAVRDLELALQTTSAANCAVTASVLLAPADQFAAKCAAAGEAFSDMRRLSDLLKLEDTISADSVWAAGGKKALSFRDTASKKETFGLVTSPALRVQAFVNGNRANQLVSESADPALVARMIVSDRDEFRSAVTSGSAETMAAFRKSRDIVRGALSASADKDADSRALLSALARARKLSEGDVDANRRVLHHLIGAVAMSAEGIGESFPEKVSLLAGYYFERDGNDEVVTDRYGNPVVARTQDTEFHAALADVIGQVLYGNEALVTYSADGSESDAGLVLDEDMRTLLACLRVGRNGRISLACKPDSRMADALRNGFDRLKTSADVVAVVPAVAEGGTELHGEIALTMGDLMHLLRVQVCSERAFDSEREGDVRVDFSTVFGSELNDMERFGTAAERTLAGRALCRVPRLENGGYDLFAEVVNRHAFDGDFSAQAILEATGVSEDVGPDLWRYASREPNALFYNVLRDMYPVAALVAMTKEGNTGHNAYLAAKGGTVLEEEEEEEGHQVISTYLSSDEAGGRVNMLRPFTAAPFKFTCELGSFDYLEDAVNALVDAQEADLTWSINYGYLDRGQQKPVGSKELRNPRNYYRYIGVSAGSRKMSGSAEDRSRLEAYRSWMGYLLGEKYIENRYVKDKPRTYNRFSYFANAGTVLRHTIGTAGADAFRSWLDSAMTPDTPSTLRPEVNTGVREAVEFVSANAGKFGLVAGGNSVRPKLASPSVGYQERGGTLVRMSRNGILGYMREQNPERFAETPGTVETNVRTALEKAFGSWESETGVRVTRIVRTAKNGTKVPVNLLRVDRKLKTKDGTKVAHTYISTGDALGFDAGNEAYLEGLVNIVNANLPEGKRITVNRLRGIGAENVEAVAKAAGVRALGESDTALTTNSLLMLTGLVRFSNDANYFTLFHEYFHQMLDLYRRIGACTEADMAALAKRFGRDGAFNEEEAADAFARYVTGADEAEAEGGKLSASGLGGDAAKIFSKFKRTAQAFLAGGIAFDNRGVPVVLKMVVSGDLSRRELDAVQELAEEELSSVEDMILNEDATFEIEQDYGYMEGPLRDMQNEVIATFMDLCEGDATLDDLKAKAEEYRKALADAEPVTFPATAEPFGVKPPATPKPLPRPPKTNREIANDSKRPSGERLHAFLEDALSRFDGSPEYANLRKEVLAVTSMLAGDRGARGDSAIVEAAMRIVRETAASLGLYTDEDESRDTVKAILGHSVEHPKQYALPDGSVLNFEDENHTYWIDNPDGSKSVFVSGTSFCSLFGSKFDEDRMSRSSAAKGGKTPEQVLAKWQYARERGTKLHSVFEDVLSGAAVRAVPMTADEWRSTLESLGEPAGDEDVRKAAENELAEIRAAAKAAKEMLEWAEPVGSELLIADKTAKVAGQVDLLVRAKVDVSLGGTEVKAGDLVLVDHKTNRRKPGDHAGAKRLKGAFSAYGDTALEHYRLQLNLYREILCRNGEHGVKAGADPRSVKMVINYFNGKSQEYIAIADRHDAMEKALKAAPMLVSSRVGDLVVQPRRKRAITLDTATAELAVRLAHRMADGGTMDPSGAFTRTGGKGLYPEEYSMTTWLLGNVMRGDTSSWNERLSEVLDETERQLDEALRLVGRAAEITYDTPGAEDTAALRDAMRLVRENLRPALEDVASGGDLSAFGLDPASFGSARDLAEAIVESVFSETEGLPSNGMLAAAKDTAARAVGAALLYRRFAVENGVEKPAAGALPRLPENPVVPPEYGVDEPEVTPQLILQSPESWLASVLQRNFMGASIRDLCTDTSLQAETEEPNRVCNLIDSYFGADVTIGGRLREISYGTSDLAFDDDGTVTASERNRHLVMKRAAVRDALGGYSLGMVVRKAKETGRALTKEDANLINWALQTVSAIATGCSGVNTGFDLSPSSIHMLKDAFAPWTATRVGDLSRDGRRVARTLDELIADGGWFSFESLVYRVAGQPKGFAVGEDRPTNLDQALYRMVTRLPEAITGVHRGSDGKVTSYDRSGLYCRILDIVREQVVAAAFPKEGEPNVTQTQLHENIVRALSRKGLARTSSESGETVIRVPVSLTSDKWMNSDLVRMMCEEGGRKKSLLDLRYAADAIAASATKLHEAACRAKFLRSQFGGHSLTTAMAPGLWFEAGTGHHGLVGSTFSSLTEQFAGEVSMDEKIPARYLAFVDTLTLGGQRVGFERGSRQSSIVGNMRAFPETDDDGSVLTEGRVTPRQIQHLMVMIGESKSRRPSQDDMDEFLRKVEKGLYATDDWHGERIDPEMTVFEFDALMFRLNVAALAKEAQRPGSTALTRPTSEDGFGFTKQDLVNLRAILERTEMQLSINTEVDRKMSGIANSLSEDAMFDELGMLGSSKTATERLRSMAESIVASERFRGCLTRMLTTVGSDGHPNYIVKPNANTAKNFAPDEFWGALARFMASKFPEVSMSYDPTASGVENMRQVAGVLEAVIEKDRKAERRPGALHFLPLPLEEIGGNGVFDAIWAVADRPDDNNELLNAAVGGEAAGYMKQLFGSLQSPSVWSGWRTVDRMMAYSKAASVGLSAFFAFATRWESPVAAVGLWNTLMGYKKGTAELARRLAKHKNLAKFLGFRENLPYLADFAEAITSDDPAVREYREFLDLIHIPLSAAVSNPMTDRAGAIDSDIARACKMLERGGHYRVANELRDFARAALHNPGEYAFSNVLNCVMMATAAQTMHRLREECRAANRPFDPVREMRRYSAYLNAEIGGIQHEQYAWLTPGMQQLLRMTMFSYQWTMGSWIAGSGEIVSDMLFGGHHTTPESRRYAFIRWLRMLGVIKVGVPVTLQLVIRGLAKLLTATGLVGDPDDPEDKDPLGIEDMPWLCFYNESKIGPLSFDVTPILKLAGRIGKVKDDIVKETFPGTWKGINAAFPAISSVAGGILGGLLTRSVGGSLIGAAGGLALPKLLPSYKGVGNGANSTGRRRYYMHFGKQSDEYFRWFTDGWAQATNKLSIPLQKVLEAFFGSNNGSSFEKAFKDKDLIDRFINSSVFDPNNNAITNFFTAFLPFSAASVASHPDAGILGMFAPVQMGASTTGTQKRITARIREFALDDSSVDVWSSPRNKKSLELLCSDILREARANGVGPDEALRSGLALVTKDLYVELFEALPKTAEDTVDARRAGKALRALFRVNRKLRDIKQSVSKKYADANVDWKKQKNANMRKALMAFLRGAKANPQIGQEESEAIFDSFFGQGSEPVLRSTQMDEKGGEDFSNFLATDRVPDTIFGIPVVSRREDYTEEDLEFFKANPRAGGYYDMGDEETEGEEPPEGPEPTPPEEPIPPRADEKGGEFSDRANAAIAETVDFLRTHEGFRPDAYRDTEGVPTIGYGQTNILNRAVTMDDRGMSEPDARKWMETRVRENAVNLYKRHPWMQKLSTGALAAAYDLAYNMGDGIFMKANSPGFNRRLDAGEDPEKVFWSELPTYVGGKDADARTRKGLKNRRNDAIKRWKGVK